MWKRVGRRLQAKVEALPHRPANDSSGGFNGAIRVCLERGMACATLGCAAHGSPLRHDRASVSHGTRPLAIYCPEGRSIGSCVTVMYCLMSG
jgi:hypothetical protein